MRIFVVYIPYEIVIMSVLVLASATFYPFILEMSHLFKLTDTVSSHTHTNKHTTIWKHMQFSFLMKTSSMLCSYQIWRITHIVNMATILILIVCPIQVISTDRNDVYRELYDLDTDTHNNQQTILKQLTEHRMTSKRDNSISIAANIIGF